MTKYVCPRCGARWAEEPKDKHPTCMRCHDYGVEVDDAGREKKKK